MFEQPPRFGSRTIIERKVVLFGEYSHTRNGWVRVYERAYAKVNLLLFVGKKQGDGYHPVVTVLQNLGLHDDVQIRVRPWDGHCGRNAVEVTTDDPELPHGMDNLAGRAASRLLETAEVRGHFVSIDIKKRIPVSAGLAGGSADAAAVLRGLSRGLQLEISAKQLLSVAADLGSDVPACLVGGTLLGVGRGERVFSLKSERLWWVLANPGTRLATSQVYACFDEAAPHGGTCAQALDRPLDELAPGFRSALARGDAEQLATLLHNDLEMPARRLQPEVSRLVAELKACGPLATLVSGSGPTVAGLAADERHAQAIADRLRGRASWVWWGPSMQDAVWTGGKIPTGT